MRPYRRQAWEYNICSYCGKFRPWGELVLNFVPDSDYSSENESTRQCKRCREKRKPGESS